MLARNWRLRVCVRVHFFHIALLARRRLSNPREDKYALILTSECHAFYVWVTHEEFGYILSFTDSLSSLI